MKLTKRVLSMVIAIMLVASTFVAVPTFAEFSDLDKKNFAYDAVDVLSKLGVINGYEEDGTLKFKPDNNVTRAEFTAMLLRTRGMGAVGSTSLIDPPFPDVVTPDVSWAIANIRTAREMGIINGYDDGTFKPNNNVSYEEAVKMIVCALGYGNMGADGAFWYSKYLMTATSLGFLEGAGGAIATPATRATIAKMLYNCLEVNLAEDNALTNKTILENDLNLKKNVGYIDSNPEISLSTQEPNLRDNEVQIAAPDEYGVYKTSTYKVDDASKYADMLGAQITFYYTVDRNSGFNVLIMASVKKSETIEIEADLIHSYTDSTIEYVTNPGDDRTITASIAGDSVVVYNGKLYGATKADSKYSTYYSNMGSKAMPTIGSVKLLDRDGDNRYDVVFVESYEAWVVSSRTTSNYTIVDNILRKDMTNDGNKLVLNPKKVDFYDVDGKESSFNSIGTGTVVCVKKVNSEAVEAIICKNAITGTITATNSKTGYTIGDKTYQVSKQAPWKNPIAGAKPDTTTPQRGDGGKFYLDCNGNILAYDKTESASNQQYGYITSARYKNENFEESLTLVIVTKSNVKGAQYVVTEKTKFNGNPVADLATFESYIDVANDTQEANYPNGSGGTYAQLVKFTIASGNKLDEIVTATATADTPEKVADDTLNLYNAIPLTSAASYNKSTKKFSASGSKNIYVSSALILKVPENKSGGTYRVMSASELETGSDYRVELYDVNATYSAKVALVYKGADTVGKVKATSPVMVVTEVSDGIDGDETRYTLKGFVGTSAVEYKLSTEDAKTAALAPTIKKGDVVRLGKDDEGYYTLRHEMDGTTNNEHIIFSMTAGYRDTLNKPSNKIEWGSSSTADYEAWWGSAYRRSEDGLMISEDVLAGTEAEDTITHRDIIATSNISSAKVFTYEMKNGDLEITKHDSSENEAVINSLQTYNGTDKPSEVFVHIKNNAIKTLIVVVR